LKGEARKRSCRNKLISDNQKLHMACIVLANQKMELLNDTEFIRLNALIALLKANGELDNVSKQRKRNLQERM